MNGFSLFLCAGFIIISKLCIFSAPSDELLKPIVNPTLAISVDRPILVSGQKSDKLPTTKISVVALNFPKDASLTYDWKAVQDVLSPFAARLGSENKIIFNSSDAGSTIATFSGSGVFAIRLTVTDSKNKLSISKNTWVNVWSAKSRIIVNGKEDPLGVAPGILPPTSVRTLSPDPGPFCHPRLLCTDKDWAEINQRCREGKIASKAVEKLRKDVSERFDQPGSTFAKLTSELVVFAEANFQGTSPDLTMGLQAEKTDKGPNWDNAMRQLMEYGERLRNACFLAWLDLDPSIMRDEIPEPQQERIRKLAKTVGALTHALLTGCWNTDSGKFNLDYPLFIRGINKPGDVFADMSCIALSYDFVASWMTKSEQNAACNFLFAQSVGRTTGARVPGFASGIHGRLLRGQEQNGDFMNIEEAKIFSALVVEGEEGVVSEAVLKTFGALPKPNDYETSPDFREYDWIQFADFNGGGGCEASKPYPESSAWPHARKASIDNLQRGIYWNDDWYVSPWGFTLNREAYYGFSAWGLWPASLVFARHGAQNQFVTGLYYQTINHLLYSCYPGEGETKSDDFSSLIYLYDHHDSDHFDYRQNHVVLLKYMYPDDPAVDYIYAANAPTIGFNPFMLALFGMDPGVGEKPSVLPELAEKKALPLTQMDPQIGFIASRSGWQENDLLLHFDTGWLHAGHMHAEKNSFSLFALGRAWSIAPGYHVVNSNYQSGILIQDPAYAKDPKTEGYIGESPGEIPEGSPYPKCFPTPPGRLVEATQGENYTLMAGDAKAAYDYSYGGDKPKQDIGKTRVDFMYPGLLEDLISRLPANKDYHTRKEELNPDFNPVRYAFRTILLARGERPYVLIIDDIKKDDTPRNYRWVMNCVQRFGPPSCRFVDQSGKGVRTSLAVASGATGCEAVLYHTPIDDEKSSGQEGLPRMLLRDLSELDPTDQPLIRVDKELGSLFVDRNNLVEPKYKILLFPYRTGESVPECKWSKDKKSITIDLKNGWMDIVTFDSSNPDHRTRLAFKREKARF